MNELRPRMKDLCQLCRYGVEVTVKIPHTVFTERDSEGNLVFKETQEAYERLKKDEDLIIREKELKIPVKEDEHDVYWYRIITIKLKQDSEQ